MAISATVMAQGQTCHQQQFNNITDCQWPYFVLHNQCGCKSCTIHHHVFKLYSSLLAIFKAEWRNTCNLTIRNYFPVEYGNLIGYLQICHKKCYFNSIKNVRFMQLQ